MILTATSLAISPGLTSSFMATGGSLPYTYSISVHGSGGSINATTGLYTAPTTIGRLPDTVRATDSLGVYAEANILIGTPLLFLCDIIRQEMGLGAKQVYIYNQKINIPIDSDLYVAIGVMNCKPFSNNISYDSSGNSIQSTNFLETVTIDIMSRGMDALNRKEEVIMALNSQYAQTQQELNSFYISKLSTGFINLSQLEASAIPYRFQITVSMQYFVKKTKAVSYFDNNFGITGVCVEP